VSFGARDDSCSGVPLINGIRDAISNYLGTACAKLTFVGVVIFAIALGLFTAAVITAVDIPISASVTISSIPEDVIYSAITFPGVLAMVPGSYAFRTVFGLLNLMRVPAKDSVYVQGETLSLVVTTILLMIVIAVGLAIPLAIPINRSPERISVKREDKELSNEVDQQKLS
jgi:uncharacterized membrane protein YjjB (DUF3815 family)